MAAWSDQPSGVGTPDSGWQMSGHRGCATAALSSTTPAGTTAGTTAGRQHTCGRAGGLPGAGTPERTEHRDMKASSNARQRNRRGTAPKHRGGNTTRGETPQGGKQPTGEPHPPTPPPPRVLYKKRAAVRDWPRWEKILGLPRETEGTPHCRLMQPQGSRKILCQESRSSDFRVKLRAPPTAGSCSHRVAEILYASKRRSEGYPFGLPCV